MTTQTIRRYPLDAMMTIEKRLTPGKISEFDSRLQMTGTMHMIQTELKSLMEQSNQQKREHHHHGHDNFEQRESQSNRSRHRSYNRNKCTNGQNHRGHSQHSRRHRNHNDFTDFDKQSNSGFLSRDKTNEDKSWERIKRPMHCIKGDTDFQKSFRLILNSLIETNREDICKRIDMLCQTHGITSETKLDEIDVQTFMSTTIIEAACMQPLYSSHYADIVKHITSSIFKESHKTFEIHICELSYKVKVNDIAKNQAKGFAKFITNLYLTGIGRRQDLEYWANQVIDMTTSTDKMIESVACELLVWFGLELSQNDDVKSEWLEFVTTKIGPLWSDDGPLSLRSQIRLMDVRDAFE